MLERAAEHIRQAGDNIFSLVLYKNGEWDECTVCRTAPCQNCYSLTKTVIATGIGMAQDQGLLSVDEPILHYLEKDLPDKVDEKLERVKIRHLLSQTMGNGTGYLFEADRFTHGTDDWLSFVLSQPLAYEPGSKFVYSNSTYYLLSCILHRATGVTAESFIRQNLFQPLGIGDYAWATCPKGETSGGTGLYLSTEDLAKIGYVYLQQGEYAGKRLLSREWIREATCNQGSSPEDPAYGYSFWMNRVGYEGNGAYRQIMLIVPDKQLVLAAHAFQEEYDYIALLEQCGIL